MPKLKEKPSALKKEHPALPNMKILYFFYFCGSFLPSWIRIRIRNLNADPDPATQINADPCGSGSETLPNSQQRTQIYLLFTCSFGDGAMNKFGNGFLWRTELFIPRMLFFSVGNTCLPGRGGHKSYDSL
jgi:hypothetical protein